MYFDFWSNLFASVTWDFSSGKFFLLKKMKYSISTIITHSCKTLYFFFSFPILLSRELDSYTLNVDLIFN